MLETFPLQGPSSHSGDVWVASLAQFVVGGVLVWLLLFRTELLPGWLRIEEAGQPVIETQGVDVVRVGVVLTGLNCFIYSVPLLADEIVRAFLEREMPYMRNNTWLMSAIQLALAVYLIKRTDHVMRLIGGTTEQVQPPAE